MDVLNESVGVVLAGLAFLLAAIGASAAARYRDARLGLVAGGLGVLGVVGVLSVLHEISPKYGGPFEVAPVPLLLLVVAVGFLYAALVRGGSRRPAA